MNKSFSILERVLVSGACPFAQSRGRELAEPDLNGGAEFLHAVGQQF
jgi:hypothetical protein